MISVDVTTGAAYDAAIAAAAPGDKALAGLTSLRNSIGEDYVVKCWSGDALENLTLPTISGSAVEGTNLTTTLGTWQSALVFEAHFAGLIPFTTSETLEITGPELSGVFTGTSDLDVLGICRIESADGTRHIQGTFGLTGADFICTGALVAEDGAEVGSIVLRFAAAIETPTTVDEDEQSVVDDMLEANDAAAFGVLFRDAWNAEPETGSMPAAVVMGTDPRGENNESWFTGDATIPATYRDSDKWRYFIPYINVMEAEDGASSAHLAQNAAVRIWNQQIMLRNAYTQDWEQWAIGQSTSWSRANKSSVGQIAGAVSQRASPSGGTEVRYPVGPLAYVLQATWNGLKFLDIDEYDAIQHTFWAQLVKWDASGTDDLANAGLLIQAGASWYPTSRGGLDLQTIPGCMTSRLKFVTATPKRFSAITLLDARQANVTPSGITSTAYLADPPTLL